MRSRRDRLTAVLMLTPSLILLAIFVYGFIGRTIYVSMTDWGSRAGALALDPKIHWVGAGNFVGLFTGFLDIRFRQDLINMIAFTILFVAACLAVGLALAMLLDQRLKGEGFFRTIFLYPMSLSLVVTGTIWRWMLQPRGGVNVLPTLVGLPAWRFPWTTSRQQVLQFNWQQVAVAAGAGVAAILLLVAVRKGLRKQRRAAGVYALLAAAPALWVLSGKAAATQLVPFPEPHGFNLAIVGIVLAAVWQMSGYTMALYLAGLRAIPDELREAARVDGANQFQVYRYVEFPLLAPITLSALIILGHIALKIFDLVFAMAGPDNASTSVPAILMYVTTFRGNQFAKGASIAVMLLLLVSALIIPYLASSLRPARDAR